MEGELTNAETRQRYYSRYPERIRAAGYNWRQRNPEKWAAIQQRARLVRKYGITWEDKVRMYHEQKGLCGMCGEPLPVEIGEACVDHNHETKVVRKLLHRHCNTVVGYFEHDCSRIATLVTYLSQ